METILAILIVGTTAVVTFVNHYNDEKYCVDINVQAGDTVQTPDGSKMQVAEIKGPSMFCRNPELPVKAVLK